MKSNNNTQYLYNTITRISELVDLDDKGSSEHFVGLVEEVGEIAQDLQIENGFSCKGHKKPGDGVLIESLDAAICALCVYFSHGGTMEDLPFVMDKKLDKWEDLLKGI